MTFWNSLVGDLQKPEDTFDQRIRKAGIALQFFPFTIVSLAVAITTANQAIQQDAPWRWLTTGCYLVQVVTAVLAYIVLRRERHVSDLHLATVMWVRLFTGVLGYINSPLIDGKFVVLWLVGIALLTKMPTFPLYATFLAVSTLLLDWNFTAMVKDPSLLLSFPGAKENEDNRGFYQLLAYRVVVSCGIAGAGWVFSLQAKEVESQRLAASRAQVAAIEMTFRVLESQKQYDTEEVSRTLDECAEENLVDPKMVGLFREMNANLESYRPFLPNYLFLGSGGSRHSILSGTATPADARDTVPGGSSEEQVVSSDGENDGKIPGTSSSAAYRSNHDEESENFTREAPPHIFSEPVPATTYKGLISIAWVELRFSEWLSATKTPAKGGVVQFFTDALFDLAQTTKASVHTLVGDNVQLTWNSTHRTPRTELKASLFLLRLKEALTAALPEVKLAGACCSGQAKVHSAISFQTRQQAMYVDAPWLPALEACYTLAKRHNTLVVDANTEAGAHQQVVLQGVDCIRYVPKALLHSETGEPLSSVQPGMHGDSSFSCDGFPTAAPDSFDTLLGVTGPQQEEAAKTYLERKAVRHTFAFELVKRKSESIHDEDEWLYTRPRGEQESQPTQDVERMVTGALVMCIDGEVAQAASFIAERNLDGRGCGSQDQNHPCMPPPQEPSPPVFDLATNDNDDAKIVSRKYGEAQPVAPHTHATSALAERLFAYCRDRSHQYFQ